MASCNECKAYVGCSCNLHAGLCITCYAKSLENKPSEKTIINVKSNYYGMTKAEKIRRLNQILEENRAKESNNEDQL